MLAARAIAPRRLRNGRDVHTPESSPSWMSRPPSGRQTVTRHAIGAPETHRQTRASRAVQEEVYVRACMMSRPSGYLRPNFCVNSPGCCRCESGPQLPSRTHGMDGAVPRQMQPGWCPSSLRRQGERGTPMHPPGCGRALLAASACERPPGYVVPRAAGEVLHATS